MDPGLSLWDSDEGILPAIGLAEGLGVSVGLVDVGVAPDGEGLVSNAAEVDVLAGEGGRGTFAGVGGNAALTGDFWGEDGTLTVSSQSDRGFELEGSALALAFVAESFIGRNPAPRPPTGLTVPKSHKSSFSGS